ncbi:stalk domain-containing protein [Paenibacillus xanthanilyticus]|uniref:Stalk domain-containing protein n=1 Tax=Paenibacillus xanthanilyticus TaxID=1783531 RepID=A0ABV8JYZ5_9BACL
MIKKLLLTAALLTSSVGSPHPAAAAETLAPQLDEAIILSVGSSKVYVNGTLGRIGDSGQDAAPFVDQGTTLVPLRFVSEKLGAKLTWAPQTREIKLQAGTDTATMRVGERALRINDRTITMNAPSQTRNGVTFLPLRHVVEDVLRQQLYYKSGIIVISQEPIMISENELAELANVLKPRVVFSGGEDLIYVYGDGTSAQRSFGGSIGPGLHHAADGDGEHFYVSENNFSANYERIYKVTADGEIAKKLQFDSEAQMEFILAQDGDQYYNAKGSIVRIKGDDGANRKVLGKGRLHEEAVYIRGGVVWFTDYDDEGYAIYKLQDGKKTKLSGNDAFLKFGAGNWLYYTHYENNRQALYRMSVDGTQRTKLSREADVAHAIPVQDEIYFIDGTTQSLRKMSLDGYRQQGVLKLASPGIGIFAGDNGRIFVTTENQQPIGSSQSLIQVDPVTGAKRQLASAALDFDYGWVRIANVKTVGEYVSYSIGNEVFVVKHDGSTRHKAGTLAGGSSRKPMSVRVNF